ncbi:MAG: hypothetical protein ACOX3F_01720 [Kiritimatiellia bacterium]
MKKTLMALFALALCASVASAGVGINWSTVGAFMTIAKRTWSAVARLCSTSYSAIWQLIYAGADGIANPAD